MRSNKQKIDHYMKQLEISLKTLIISFLEILFKMVANLDIFKPLLASLIIYS